MLHDPVRPVLLAVPLVAPLDPGANLGMLVGAVVVNDQMQANLVGRFGIDLLEKSKPLLVHVEDKDNYFYVLIKKRVV